MSSIYSDWKHDEEHQDSPLALAQRLTDAVKKNDVTLLQNLLPLRLVVDDVPCLSPLTEGDEDSVLCMSDSDAVAGDDDWDEKEDQPSIRTNSPSPAEGEEHTASSSMFNSKTNAMHWAAYSGNTTCLSILHESNSGFGCTNTTIYGSTPTMLASGDGGRGGMSILSIFTYIFLCARYIDIFFCFIFIIVFACLQKCNGFTRSIYKANALGETALHIAAYAGNLAAVRELLCADTSGVHLQTKFTGQTALMMAVFAKKVCYNCM
jgi:hypothetical protein